MATFEITTPDGTFEVEAPDESAALEAVSGMGKSVASDSDQSYIGGIIDKFTTGLTGGLGPKITAAEDAILGKTPDGEWFNYKAPFDERYGAALNAERNQNAAFSEKNPISSFGAEVGGSILGMGKAARLGSSALKMAPTATKLLAKAPMASRIAGQTALGAGFGASNAYGRDENMGTGALVGGALGAGGQVVGEAVGGIASAAARKLGKAPKAKYANAAEIKAAADNAFDKARQTGAVYSKAAMKKMQKDVLNHFIRRGYRGDNEPGAKVVARLLKELSEGHQTVEGLIAARRVIQNSARTIEGGAPHKSNNALVYKALEIFDDMLGNNTSLLPGQGNAGFAAYGNIKKGLDYSRRGHKYKAVSKAASKAQRRAASTSSGGNVQNATKQNIARILDSESKVRGFKPDEISGLNKVVEGTTIENVLRMGGKYSPTSNNLTTGAGLVGGGGAALMGHPELAAAAATVGGISMASKAASNAMTRGNVSKVLDLIASGGVALPPSQIQLLLDNPSTKTAIGRALTSGLLSVSQAVSAD